MYAAGGFMAAYGIAELYVLKGRRAVVHNLERYPVRLSAYHVVLRRNHDGGVIGPEICGKMHHHRAYRPKCAAEICPFQAGAARVDPKSLVEV